MGSLKCILNTVICECFFLFVLLMCMLVSAGMALDDDDDDDDEEEDDDNSRSVDSSTVTGGVSGGAASSAKKINVLQPLLVDSDSQSSSAKRYVSSSSSILVQALLRFAAEFLHSEQIFIVNIEDGSTIQNFIQMCNFKCNVLEVKRNILKIKFRLATALNLFEYILFEKRLD